MNARRISIIIFIIILFLAIFTGVVNALNGQAKPVSHAVFSHVGDYSPAITANGTNYAVDGGLLFVGSPSGWLQIDTPKNIIVSAVAADSKNPKTIFIGAANEMAVFLSRDGGRSWFAVQLLSDHAGGVTDIAVDSVQRLVYVGTDTAGLFRLRDVGSRLIVTGQLLTDEPVIEVAADNTGAGLAFARTKSHLYRSEHFGMTWVTVDNLQSVATVVEIANTTPATIYVGTVDRGVLESRDGLSWTMANHGLGMVPGSRLSVDALAVDPTQPNVLYIATSYLYGTTEVHSAPGGVAMSTDSANVWSPVSKDNKLHVAALFPVSGQTGAVYALTTTSHTPLALGYALEFATTSESVTITQGGLTSNLAAGSSWIIAALATLALAYAVINDLHRHRPQPTQKLALQKLAALS